MSVPHFLNTFRAQDIKKYYCTSGIYTLLLHDERIVHLEPENGYAFSRWLEAHHITDIRTESF